MFYEIIKTRVVEAVYGDADSNMWNFFRAHDRPSMDRPDKDTAQAEMQHWGVQGNRH